MANRIGSGFLFACLLAGSVAVTSCGGGGSDSGGGGNPAPKTFWVEPAGGSTVIGIGQSINVYAAFKANASDPYPAYVDAAQVAWTSSNPACAAISASGAVTGLAACSTVITANYQSHADQLTVQVSGNWVNRSVTVAGQGVRQYSLYVPDFGGAGGSHPALLSLHGGGGSAMIQAASSRLVELAGAQKIYVAFLEGSGAIKTFNGGACCGYAATNNIDDVAYASAVIDDIESRDSVNAAKVYSTGFSNGGIMSHRLACAIADRISGIAAVSGASGQYDQNLTQYYTCNPARPIPVLHIHATNDRNYPYAGGTGDGLSATAYYPVEATIADWRARNNVTAQATAEAVTATTTCYKYETPANASLPSARVTLCKVNPVDVFDSVNEIVFGGGHSWPGGTRSPSAKSDVPVTDFSADTYLWRFFNP
jgi:polyhydroxybutyrate depolymerase